MAKGCYNGRTTLGTKGISLGTFAMAEACTWTPERRDRTQEDGTAVPSTDKASFIIRRLLKTLTMGNGFT